MRRNEERGSSAVEFALTFTVIIVPLLFGIMEYGYYFFQQTLLRDATRTGARLAALQDRDADFQTVVGGHVTQRLAALGVPGEPVVTTVLSGEAPATVLSVQVQVAYPGLIGLLPTPDHLGETWTVYLEDQED